jgi:hypothetical protein
MNRSLRLFRTGVSLVALAAVGCGSSTPSEVDGGKTDGAAGSKTDGSAGAGGAAGKGGGSGGAKGGAGGAAAGTSGGTAGTGGEKTDGGGLDLSGIAPPTTLTATVLDRRATTFELVWTAPSINGAAVTGYQVRYAKVPITTTNFDDTTITTAVTYTGTPKAPGETDGMTVKLYIENAYYFAVEGANPAGDRSPLSATTAAVAAHFNVTTLTGTSGTSEGFGSSVSGDGDLNGDGISDVAVGTFSAGRAYLFLGSSTFSPSQPAVVFSGTQTGFGYAVAQIGDVDGDGLEDLAISDALNGEKIYIYKGRRTWPMTLTDAQADYVITTDASYASSLFGFSIARLGDFTGDGIDDFAIGVRSYASGVGRVVIVRGKASGFASIALPDAANSITIDGDSTLDRPFFGYRVLGLGHFYTASTGTTLVVSAAGSTSATAPGNDGHIYAFHGQTGTSGAIALSAADNALTGPGSGAHIGIVLTNLATMLNGSPAVGIGNLRDTVDIPGGQGGAYLDFGTPTSGIFASQLIAYLTGDTTNSGVMIGGGVSGRDTKLSLIGDATPDFVLGGEGGLTFTISDGAKIGGRASPNDTAATAEVSVTLPANWASGEGTDSIIPDINGDGVSDFSVGASTQPGAVLVYW